MQGECNRFFLSGNNNKGVGNVILDGIFRYIKVGGEAIRNTTDASSTTIKALEVVFGQWLKTIVDATRE